CVGGGSVPRPATYHRRAEPAPTTHVLAPQGREEKEDHAMPTVVHLTASTFLGGPERQMLGLANALSAEYRTAFVLFPEGGRCRPFVGEVGHQGFEAAAPTHDTPWVRAAVRELVGRLGVLGADMLCCHGYKANLLGRPAARRAGIPAVAVSRGWTGESFK